MTYKQLGEYYYNLCKETALEAANWTDVLEHSCEYERRNESSSARNFLNSYRTISFLRRSLLRGAC